MAMSMTEADDGTVWSASYPNCGLVAFDPKTRNLRDFGSVHTENWAEIPRALATDDAGWVYIGVGNTGSQILIFDPRTGQARPFLAEHERRKGGVHLERDRNGKVYGLADVGGPNDWFELYRGEAQGRKGRAAPREADHHGNPRPVHQDFPDGKRMVRCDTIDRVLVTSDPRTKRTMTVPFDYPSEGAHLMCLAAAPDGTICGGTAFPMRFFTYDPKTDRLTNRTAFGQFNTIRQGKQFFMGGYPRGFPGVGSGQGVGRNRSQPEAE